MKERPILFSAPMVNAIFDDLKSQTRRTKGLYHINQSPNEWRLDAVLDSGLAVFNRGNGYEVIKLQSPYGSACDRLWVKETYVAPKEFDHLKPSEIPVGTPIDYTATDISYPIGKTRPSIFMCRWMSRIDLEITDVLVERVWDISEEDAMAEGIESFTKDGVGFKYGLDGWVWSCDNGKPYMCRTPKIAFENLWDSINAKTHPWESNPWVWVVSFERVK